MKIRIFVTILFASSLVRSLYAQDSLSINQTGSIYSAWGQPLSIDFAEDLAFLKTYNGLSILNIENPVEPILLKSIQTGFHVSSIKNHGRTVFYPMDESGIAIYNFENLDNYSRRVFDLRPHYIETLTFDGDLLISVGDKITIFSFNQPDSLQLLSTLNLGLHDGVCVTVKDSLAYLGTGDEGGLKIIDIRNHENLHEIAFLEIEGGCNSIVLNGDLAYLGNYWFGLVVADISDPRNPEILSILPYHFRTHTIAGKDNFIYMVENSDLVIRVDVTEPFNPVITDTIQVEGNDLRIQGDYLYIPGADGGLGIVDLSNPDRFELSESFTPPRMFANIETFGETAFLISEDGKFRIVDIGDRHFPVEISTLDIDAQSRWSSNGNDVDIHVEEEFAFICNRSTLYVIDIRNPREPRLAHSLVHRMDIQKVPKLHFYDDFCYIGEGDPNSGGPISIVQILENGTPVFIVTVEDVADGRLISTGGDRLVVEERRMKFFELSLHGIPRMIASQGKPNGTFIAFRNNVAIFNDRGIDSLLFYDTSDPENFRRLGGIDVSYTIASLNVKGDYLLLARNNSSIGSDTGDIEIVDISNLESPRVVARKTGLRRLQGFDLTPSGTIVLNDFRSLQLYEAPGVLSMADDPLLPTVSPSLSAFPNPFNSTVTISYSVGQVSKPVSLAIYDTQGRLVADLSYSTGDLNRRSLSGEQKVVWEAGELPAGVYLVIFNSDNRKISQKIILMK